MSFSSLASALSLFLVVTSVSAGETSWQGTNPTWSTDSNWSTGSSPPKKPESGAVYPGDASIQKVDLAGPTGRLMVGARFDFKAGGSGYTFSGTEGSVAGFIIRAGGKFNGIINNDDSPQTFNVPIKLTSNAGMPGSAAAMIFNAASGDLVFNGNNNAEVAPWTINLNGASALTFKTATGKTISVGLKGPGQIVNTNGGSSSGLTKVGPGKLVLGGTEPNTFVGKNTIEEGTVTAGKANAFGSGNALKVTGTATFDTGGFNQNIGALELQGNLTIDMGNAGMVSFADCKNIDWGGAALLITGYAPGSSVLQFGRDATGLTPAQLDSIIFTEIGNSHGQIDSKGHVTPLIGSGGAAPAITAVTPTHKPAAPKPTGQQGKAPAVGDYPAY